ncbi:unnamed protein product [Echinostoma caproni]|uniref:Tetraspanin n=1 Tax=Echinostoma caproni TaxID=27848 RepID=A0A183A6F5_9TREM|nr:unnamed protein product [Echinostoma caproni]
MLYPAQLSHFYFTGTLLTSYRGLDQLLVKITDNAKTIMADSVNNYVSINSTDVYSSLLTFVMPAMKCCGVMNGSDFDQSTTFQRDYSYNGQQITLRYPVPCCKFDGSYKPQANCPVDFNSSNSNINQGCWPLLQTELDQYGRIVAYVCLGIIGLQVNTNTSTDSESGIKAIEESAITKSESCAVKDAVNRQPHYMDGAGEKFNEDDFQARQSG